MDTFEFLGGKYQAGEQILPGVIQTYRAMELATGRSVFVHRVASSDAPEEQMVLYRLLCAALVRSAAVRSMVLDMREDTRDWVIVTETDPRCLLLREWLQFELNNSGKAPEAEKKVSKPEESHRSLLNGEATPAALETPALPAHEPGEFTRFFQAGPNTTLPAKLNPQDQPAGMAVVQRPHTPMPYVPLTQTSSPTPGNNSGSRDDGEFSKVFSGPQADRPSLPATLPGAHQSADDFDNLFAPEKEARAASRMPAATVRNQDGVSSGLTTPHMPHLPAPTTPAGSMAAAGSVASTTGSNLPRPTISPTYLQSPSLVTSAPPVAPLNRNLIIFLSVLGMLAVILILLVLFAPKK